MPTSHSVVRRKVEETGTEHHDREPQTRRNKALTLTVIFRCQTELNIFYITTIYFQNFFLSDHFQTKKCFDGFHPSEYKSVYSQNKYKSKLPDEWNSPSNNKNLKQALNSMKKKATTKVWLQHSQFLLLSSSVCVCYH